MILAGAMVYLAVTSLFVVSMAAAARQPALPPGKNGVVIIDFELQNPTCIGKILEAARTAKD